MTPATFGNRLDEMISAIVEVTITKISKSQAGILDEVIALVSALETDAAGNIKPSRVNIRTLSKIESSLGDAMLTPEYQRSVRYLQAELGNIQNLMDEYLSGEFKGFDPNSLTLETTVAQSLNMVEDMLLREGFKLEIVNKVRNIVSSNVTSGLRYRDLIAQTREFLTANGGRLARWSKTIVTDAAYQHASAYIQTAAQDLDAKWWKYQGGVISDTRPFCAARDGKYFTTEEVRAWASKDWEGKNPLTTADTIWLYRGGYNCRHNLVPVLADSVPADVKAGKQ